MNPWFHTRSPARTESNDGAWLVVLEAERGEHDLRLGPDEGRNAIVIGHDPDQSPALFADRVVARLSELERASRSIERAIVRIVPCESEESMSARERIGRALLSHSASRGASELLFVVKAGASSSLRRRMLDLVEGLMDGHSTTQLRIRVSFGDTPASTFMPSPRSH